jgi:hypothetical protein
LKCPHCSKVIDDKLIIKESARIRGSIVTKRKKVSSKINGKKGGRPLKNKTKSDGDVK